MKRSIKFWILIFIVFNILVTAFGWYKIPTWFNGPITADSIMISLMYVCLYAIDGMLLCVLLMNIIPKFNKWIDKNKAPKH